MNLEEKLRFLVRALQADPAFQALLTLISWGMALLLGLLIGLGLLFMG